MLEESQIKILMRMHELEQSLAELYAVFAEKLPAHRELFLTLVREENEHAEAVQKFYRLTYQNAVSFSEGSTRLAAIESIIDYVKKAGDLARTDQILPDQALELSRDLEKSLVAKNIFQHFKVRVDLANLLRYLRDSSEEHAQLVQAEIDRSRKKRPV